MPKIRDLGISTISFPRPPAGIGTGRYWMCSPTGDPEGFPEDDCHPTPPHCHPTRKPEAPCDPTMCDPTKADQHDKDKKKTSGLPHDAVIQLKQQLQHQVHGQLH